MRICSKCDESKPESDFYKTSGARCKDCFKKQSVEIQQRDPVKHAARARKHYWASEENRQNAIEKSTQRYFANKAQRNFNAFKRSLVKLYGITYEIYEEMLKQQNGRCGICKQLPSRRLDVDHDHVTGIVRGLLCSNCNTAIGLLKEDPALFAEALNYLQNGLTEP